MRNVMRFDGLTSVCISISIVFAGALNLSAQSHFISRINTGNNMTVLIQTAINPSINGAPLANGDEIGVFRPSGLCVGAARWNIDTNCAITVWGDNGQTNDTDGIRPGELLMFRVWSASQSLEASATVTYLKGGPGYEIDGIAIAASFSAISAPPCPALFSPASGTSNASVRPTLVWHTAGGGSSYHVQVSASGLFAHIVQEDSSCTDTSFTPGELACGATYYWRVKAMNAGGSSVWSEGWNVTTAIAVPAEVSLLFPSSATAIAVDSVLFRWSKASSDVDRYSLEISKDSSMGTLFSSDSLLADTVAAVKGFKDRTTYWWRVKAHNSSGWGSYGASFKLVINLFSAVLPKSEIVWGNQLNFSRRSVQFRLSAASPVSLRIYSLHGRLVQTLFDSYLTGGFHRLPIAAADFSTGCYIVDFKAGAVSINRKISNLKIDK